MRKGRAEETLEWERGRKWGKKMGRGRDKEGQTEGGRGTMVTSSLLRLRLHVFYEMCLSSFFPLYCLSQQWLHSHSLSLHKNLNLIIYISSVHLLSHVQLFGTPWTAAHEASLSITNSWSLPKLMSIESVIPSNHLILCRPFLLLPSIFPSIRVFSNESVLQENLGTMSNR